MNEYGKKGEFLHSIAGAPKVKFSGCCVRFDNEYGYPTIHTNQQHQAIGVRSVTRTPREAGGNLQINHEAGAIVTMVASADETMIGQGSLGIRCGLSGGGGRTIAKFYDLELERYLNLRVGADWNRLKGTWSNLWLFWVQIDGS